MRNDNLYSQKLNPTTRKLEGESELIQDGVSSGLGTVMRADFSASRSGMVAWRPGKAALSQVTVFDRQGTEVGKAGPPSAVSSISLAPDERRLLAYGGDHSWLLDSGQPGRLSLGTWGWFLWSPDGSRLPAPACYGDMFGWIFRSGRVFARGRLDRAGRQGSRR